MKSAVFACAAGALLLAASPSAAKPLKGGIGIEDLAKVLRAAGYPVEVMTDNEGDPMIRSAVDDISFDILCYPNQTKPKLCASIQFSTAFDLSEGATYEQVNDWNRKRRYGQAWLDEEMDPFLDMSVELERGGSTELVSENLLVWRELVSKFKEHFDQ